MRLFLNLWATALSVVTAATNRHVPQTVVARQAPETIIGSVMIDGSCECPKSHAMSNP